MTSNFDKTLKDTKRRDLNLREPQIESVLPEHYLLEYPKFVSFLKKYYEFESGTESTTEFLDNIFDTRDVTSTDLKLLEYFEDEYLLGQNYFQGFTDKRTAVKYSSYLYRAKGTKYSIRQFFKTFFNIEPDVVYTKQYIFKLNESKIGAQSARYLTDNKLYQTFAVEIRSELSVEQWRDAYKLMAHPAGMYLGGLTQIVGEGGLDPLQYDPGVAIKPPIVLEGAGGISPLGFEQNTALFDFGSSSRLGEDSAGGRTLLFRVNMGNASDAIDKGGNDLNDVQDLQIQNLDNLYSSLGEYLTPDSPTLDDDSDGSTTYAGFDISSTETIDQERFTWNPIIDRVDGDNNQLLDSDGNARQVGDSDSEISLREAINRNL